jgi:hypothetical protein
MKPEEVSVIRSDHDTTQSVIDEVPTFEPGYQPEQLPKLEMPDLDANVQSLTASELAQVPTLMDQVTQTSETPESVPSEVLSGTETVAHASLLVSESEPSAQVLSVQADHLWEVFQVRMDTLMADIKELNDRLDQLEIRSKV